MAAKNKPYERFGSFILFKRLEEDALGDLWRGARIDKGQLGGSVAVRRLGGGNRAAITQSVAEAREIVPMLTGTTFVRNQSVGIVNEVPYIAYDYAGGRSLRYIVDRARGGTNQQPSPIPLDQAIVIAEKVALSIATTGDLKYGEKRLLHGALLPHFIWISDDGETRVAGQELGSGIIASVGADPLVAAAIGRYIAPEVRATAAPTKASEVFSMGAILFLLVSGLEPPDAFSGSAFAQAVRAAKTAGGQDVPPDIRALLDKSLALDPMARYASMTEMKAALSSLAHSGKYSATTFNLAFYLSNLLKKEMESEALDRERESKVNVAAYAEPGAPAGPREPVAAPTFGAIVDQKPKNRAPLYIAAGLVVAGGIAAGIMTMRGTSKAAAPPVTAKPAPVVAKAPPPPPVSQPVVVAMSTAPADAEAQKKAFEAAVAQKMQEEMMKLQRDYTQQLKQQQSKNAPVPTQASLAQQQQTRVQTPPATTEDRRLSAAALDERRLEQRQTQTAAPVQPPQQVAQAPVQQQPQQAAPAPQPVPAVHEGDVVEMGDLDAAPRILTPMHLIYPPMAARAKAQANVIVSALVDETGRVVDVKVLRGDSRYGFNDEAIRAMRGARFSPPMKDGKRVKTWRPQAISFTP